MLKEFWLFIKEEKVWWITPIAVILILLVVLVILTESKAVLPFVYSVF